MDFHIDSAGIYIPDNLPEQEALARTTHMSVGAHHDDLEIMAYDGIQQCFQKEDQWFCGVVLTDGSGSPRKGLYSDYSDDEMKSVRRKEQIKAAEIGEYASQIFLDYTSLEVKNSASQGPVQDLVKILISARPAIVYTHNLADKHDTHVAVALRTISAIRSLPERQRPQKLFGCEVWRDLDWMVAADKVAFDNSARENLQVALLGVFDSQISGGKRYDLAVMGRRRAHGTFSASHDTDAMTGLAFAMDLSPLIVNPEMDIFEYVSGYIYRFKEDINDRILRMHG